MTGGFFNVADWRRCVVAPSEPPSDAQIVLLLDAALKTNAQSDDSCLACGYLQVRERDQATVLTVLDMSARQFPNGELADETLRMIQKWSPPVFRYEDIPGMDFYRALLVTKADTKGIVLPPIDAFTPRQAKDAKERRICRLGTLFDFDPPALILHNGAYIGKLLEQVERFDRGSDKKRRKNDLLDALAMLAGF